MNVVYHQAIFNAKVAKYWPDKNPKYQNPTKRDIVEILTAVQTMGENIIVETKFHRFESLKRIGQEKEHLKLIGNIPDFGMPGCFKLIPSDIYFVKDPNNESRALVVANTMPKLSLDTLFEYESESELEDAYVELGGAVYDTEEFFKVFSSASGRMPKSAVFVMELTTCIAPVIIHPKGSYFDKDSSANDRCLDRIILRKGLELLPTYNRV